MAGPAPKQTLESIVARYRREAASTPELEIRIQGVERAAFVAAIKAAGRVATGEPRLVQIISAIADPRREARGEARPPAASRIRELYFADGVRTSERFVRKEPLVAAYRPTGAPYIIALSAEHADSGSGFTCDEGAIIRVKARASFPLTIAGTADARTIAGTADAAKRESRVQLAWRIDLSIVRQLAGGSTANIAQVKKDMFPPGQTLETLIEASAKMPDARYELEMEFVGDPDVRDLLRPADVSAAADVLAGLVDATTSRDAGVRGEIAKVARLLGKSGGSSTLKQVLPQAKALTRIEYREIYPPAEYFLTDKADGVRAIAVVRGDPARGAIVTSDGATEYAGGAAAVAETVLDGELVGEGTPGAVFYAFDALVVGGQSVVAEPFEARAARIAEGVAAACAAGVPARTKPYQKVGDVAPAALEREFRAVLEAPKRPYEIDGLVLVQPGRAYADTTTFKWKPAAQNTIDFLVRRAPAGAPFAARPDMQLHYLFVGVDSAAPMGLANCPGYGDLFPDRQASAGYHPTAFAPSDSPLAYIYWHPAAAEPLDGQIVEMRCGGNCLAAGGGAETVAWEIVKIRSDRRRELATGRYFGNDYFVACHIWLNYLDPFPAAELWTGPAADYFLRPKGSIYFAQTAALSYLKTARIDADLRRADWVVDIGAGKGQDLRRFIDAGVGTLVAVDRDRAALAELIRRRLELGRKRDPHRHSGAARRDGTTVHALVADASAPAAETAARLKAIGVPAAGADALVCNLAVHYFLKTAESLANFAALCHAAVRPGGLVVVTALDGAAVHAAFLAAKARAGGTWDVFESPAAGATAVRKFSLRRLYDSDTLAVAGQKIGVLLPFSDGNYYEEYLVNFAALGAELARYGFATREISSASASVPEFEARNRLAGALTAGDRKYLELYAEAVYVRK